MRTYLAFESASQYGPTTQKLAEGFARIASMDVIAADKGIVTLESELHDVMRLVVAPHMTTHYDFSQFIVLRKHGIQVRWEGPDTEVRCAVSHSGGTWLFGMNTHQKLDLSQIRFDNYSERRIMVRPAAKEV